MQLFTQSILLLLMFTTSLTHGEVFTSQQTEDLVNFVETLRQCRGIVGVTMAVVKGNDTWTQGFGKLDQDGDCEVTSSDLFGIGSVTKTFTSALLSVFLNDTARYSWETPVVDILGEDFEFVNDQLTRQVTLKDLLVHRTGLKSPNLPIFAGSNVTTTELANLTRYFRTQTPFRDQFAYNNWMYGLLAHVTETLGGASWEDLLHDRLLQPLNMSSTRVLGKTVTVEADNFAKPHVLLEGRTVRADPAIFRISPMEAAGAIASSAEDMAKWLMLLINNGWSEMGGYVLNSMRMRQMQSAYTVIPAQLQDKYNMWKPQYPVTFSLDGYGYGWMTASYRGYQLKFHTGGIHGYTSYLAFLPHLDVGVFISNNGPEGDSNNTHINNQIFYHVADLLLQEEPWLNISNACQFPSPWVSVSSGHNATNETVYDKTEFDEPELYAGRYIHPLYGDVNVMRDGSLGLKTQYGHLEGRLFRGEEDHVAMWKVQGKLAFVFQPGNKIYYLQLTFIKKGPGLFQNMVLSIPTVEEMEFVREVAPDTTHNSTRVE